MTYLQLFIVVSLPITGLCYATLGSIKLQLSDRLELDEAKVGGLISAFGLMVGPIILLCGALSDTYGRKPVWMVGSVLVVAAFLIFARARSYLTALLATVLLAVGWTAMINVANPVMAGAFDDPFTGTNLGDAMFGAGAFVCPLLVVFLHKRFGFERGLDAIAGLAALPLV
ncbi:MAG: MFS transporter, partial [Pirellulaceae bacterium]|nr:MFS transporter [Pirellulaceae bacterium]